MSNYFQFQPDLIVEATSVCDRACAGCYAPNVISNKSAVELYREQPNLFLNTSAAKVALDTFSENSISLISIRGGEPSKHPEISSIIRSSQKRAELVVLETHGRWLLPQEVKYHGGLVAALSNSNTTVKISFDKMHGLSIEQLYSVTDFLNLNSISMLVAITEMDDASMMSTRLSCGRIPDNQIVFQKKAISALELIRPKLGVLGIDGKITGQLSSKLDSHHSNKAPENAMRRVAI